MKIRILHNFGVYERGQVFDDWPGGMCDILIGRGLIEQIKDDPVVETAETEAVVETAEAGNKPRRKRA